MNYVPPRRSDGTIQKRRERLPWPKDRPFRILSIDGGGICGILPAAVLAELERRFLDGRSITSYFDMVAGTSTGGIIALALGAGMTSAAIRDIYTERGGLIFPPRSWPARCLLQVRRLVRYGYNAKALETELSRIFHARVFGDTTVRLCIPSFEGRHGEPWIYKTPHHPDYRNDRHEKMVKVGLATAAAPTFFRALEHDGYMMVDGGLWANNPIMNALVDALACFELEREQIHVLSLGCGETQYRVTPQRAAGGLLQWRGVISAAMRAQSLNALGQAYLLLGKDRVMRIDVHEDHLAIRLKSADGEETSDSTDAQLLSIPWQKPPSRRSRQILLPHGIPRNEVRPTRIERRARLVSAIARGRRWLDEIVSGSVTDVQQIATRQKCSMRQVNMTISLAFLGPDLVRAAVEGRLPRGIGVERLRDAPAEWSRQFEALGLNPR